MPGNKYGFKIEAQLKDRKVEFEPSDEVVDELGKVVERELKRQLGDDGVSAMKRSILFMNKLSR